MLERGTPVAVQSKDPENKYFLFSCEQNSENWRTEPSIMGRFDIHSALRSLENLLLAIEEERKKQQACMSCYGCELSSHMLSFSRH